MDNKRNMKPKENHTYLDFSILGDDMLPPLILEAKDEVYGEEKGKGREKKTLGEVFKTLTEPQEQRRRVLVQVYGTKCPKNSLKTFPVTLMKILSRDELQKYISWLPHGRAFIIHQPHAFVNNVLMSYFKMSKFRSFQRQLNIWEFKRITQGRDAGAYYHELFLRGRPKLALFIRRHQIKGADAKLPSNFSIEPNLYEMTAMEPLSHCKVPPFASLNSTAVKTDDTLPKSTEKSSVTNQSAASYHSQTGSVGTSNPLHGSHCPQPNACNQHQDESNPSPSSRKDLETISLEQQRQQIIEFTADKTDDTLPKSAEKSSVTDQSAASYNLQTGSVGTSNPVHGSPCPQPNGRTQHHYEPDPCPSSRMDSETISLEQQRQQIMEFTAVETDDTLPKSTEKSSVTDQSAASYSLQTGSIGTSNPVHGSHSPQPNARTQHRDESNPSPLTRTVLETISLEQQRQQIIEYLQQTSQNKLRQAQQALAQHKATEDLLRQINETADAPHALPFQQNYLSVPLQFNNFPQTFNLITPTAVQIAPSTLPNINILPASPAIPETDVLNMSNPLSLAIALQQPPTTEER